MYAIVHNGKILELTSNPQYVLYDEKTNNLTLAEDSDMGNGLMVNNQLYSVPQHYGEVEVYKGAPIAELQYVGSGGSVLLNTYNKSNKNEEDMTDVEDAILDLNGTNQEDLDDIRQAIFDLAARLENLSSAKE